MQERRGASSRAEPTTTGRTRPGPPGHGVPPLRATGTTSRGTTTTREEDSPITSMMRKRLLQARLQPPPEATLLHRRRRLGLSPRRLHWRLPPAAAETCLVPPRPPRRGLAAGAKSLPRRRKHVSLGQERGRRPGFCGRMRRVLALLMLLSFPFPRLSVEECIHTFGSSFRCSPPCTRVSSLGEHGELTAAAGGAGGDAGGGGGGDDDDSGDDDVEVAKSCCWRARAEKRRRGGGPFRRPSIVYALL